MGYGLGIFGRVLPSFVKIYYTGFLCSKKPALWKSETGARDGGKPRLSPPSLASLRLILPVSPHLNQRLYFS